MRNSWSHARAHGTMHMQIDGEKTAIILHMHFHSAWGFNSIFDNTCTTWDLVTTGGFNIFDSSNTLIYTITGIEN